MDPRAVRDRQDRRDPRQHQPGLSHPRARVCAEPGRLPAADQCDDVQDEQLRRDARQRPRRPDHPRGHHLSRVSAMGHALRARRLDTDASALRPRCPAELRRCDQHPVHERHDWLSQGRDTLAPQHPQQRVLRRRTVRLHRGRPGVHPRALLSLLRHGDGQPRCDDARCLHGHPRTCLRPGGDPARRAGRAVHVAVRRPPDVHPGTRVGGLGVVRPVVPAPRHHGGSPCPVEVMKRVIEDMGCREVTICYGMTETSPVSTQTRVDDDIERRVSTVGTVHPHVEVKVVDPETGLTVPCGEPGEFCTRGYSVMLGYWNESEKTREAIDEAGWMHTGDLATMDADGYLNIVGRIKDMVIRGGENVYPREVEEFLYSHPAVADVQVVGVPDEKYGEELCAWIRVREGENVSEEDVRAFCQGKLAHFKGPRYVLVVDEFPMTVTGKIQKFKMREVTIERLGLQSAAATRTA